MKYLKFWKKTYLSILLLFMMCLTIGILIITFMTQRQNLQTEIDKALVEQHYITEKMAQDIYIATNQKEWVLPNVYNYYQNYYDGKDNYLALLKDSKLIFNDLPVYDENMCNQMIEPNKTRYVIEKTNGTEYLYIVRNLPAPIQNYTIIYVQDLSSLNKTWWNMVVLSLSACVGISTTLAIGLFYVLRRLSNPLEEAAMIAEQFASGDYLIRMKNERHDEIGDLANSFNYMADTLEANLHDLKEVAKEKQRIVDNLSHEIRTPLTIICGNAERIQYVELNDSEKYQAATSIVDESKKIQNIAQRILELGTLRNESVKKEFVSMQNVLSKVIERLTRKATSQGIECLFESSSDELIQGDAILLESLFSNLLENAIHSMDTKGTIMIKTETFRNSYHIQIIDQGHGMDESDMSHLGEPFYRPDKARSRSKGGTGLGLALCYQIVELHQAEIKFLSKKGKGTTVSVIFTTLK